MRRSRPSRTWPGCGSPRPTRTRPAGSSRSGGIPVDVIPISGAVEVAPRLGLAEGIVDLVSTGSTLVMNGLRQIGDVLASEAVLVANPTADRERSAELTAIDTMLSAVIAARGRKYLMMNAPAGKLPELEDLLPGPGVADGHPARPRGHDRDPLGRRGGRGLGPPASPEGRRRLGHPRAADREDRAVTATRIGLRRLDLGRGRRRRPGRGPRTTTRSSGAAPCPHPRSARAPAPRSPRSGPAATPRSAPRTHASVAAARTVGSSSTPTISWRPATRSNHGSGARSTRRSTTSAGSPRPSGRPRRTRRSCRASRSNGAGRRSRRSAPTSRAARRRTRRRSS